MKSDWFCGSAVSFFVIAGVACSMFLAAAPGASESNKPSTFSKAFAEFCSSQGIVGASYLEIDRIGEQDRQFFGLADSSLKEPVGASTIFHWASVTKTLTAVAIMQLRERGKLSLDDPILKYVPELSRIHSENNAIASVTLRHILSHTAGFQSSAASPRAFICPSQHLRRRNSSSFGTQRALELRSIPRRSSEIRTHDPSPLLNCGQSLR